MTNWQKLIGVETLMEKGAEIVDRFVRTKDEKAAATAELEGRISDFAGELERTVRQELAARQAIMVAELRQGDNFTKRARPSIVYFGLAFIAWAYFVHPYLVAITGWDIPAIELPAGFWAAWGSVTGLYGLGRSWEKRQQVSHLRATDPVTLP